jgi:hypothetical protein|nr:hypothetical protein [uncultured Oscillibacter sp.]
MKSNTKEHRETLHKYRWNVIKAMVIGMLFTAFFAVGVFLRGAVAERDMAWWKSFVLMPEPEVCTLCGSGIPYQAPVLVNLSTGETGEMRVYDPDPQCRYELAEEQSTSTFSFLHVAGLTGCRDTCNHTSYVTLPENGAPISPVLFCRVCRVLLADAATEGYILDSVVNK